MNTELFIAKRIFGARNGMARISKPAVTIAQWGVAVGIIVMTVSVCITVGFKNEIRDKITGFGGHIQITNNESDENGSRPLTITQSEADSLRASDGISHVQTFIQKPGLVMAGDEYEGVILKGIGNDYDTRFFASHIKEGTLPHFSDTASSGSILLSRTLAARLDAGIGDKVNIYFMQNGIKARRPKIAGIYETHYSDMDNLLILTDMHTLRRIGNIDSDKYSGVEIYIDDYTSLSSTRDSLLPLISRIAASHNESLYVPTIEESNSHMFSWLNVLDRTVWIILVLVLGISGFTVISGLLILILEKTSFIGTLKALGARNLSIRKIFLYYAMFIIGRGMIYGNVIALALCLVQKHGRIIALDPGMYYMDSVPIEFTWWLLPMNIAMFTISVAMLVIPSMLISRIEPTKAIKFD